MLLTERKTRLTIVKVMRYTVLENHIP